VDSTELIVELAKQIEAQQAAHQIWYWLAIAAVSFVFGAAGSFVSGRFKKQGETSAIQKDLDTIKKQQATIAAAVATVQADVSHEEWKRRELVTLKREKMERFLTAALECPAWSTRSAEHAWGIESAPEAPDPAAIVDSLSVCYFPELRRESLRLARISNAITSLAWGEQIRRLEVKEAKGSLPVVENASRMFLRHLYLTHLHQAEIVARAGATLMRRLLGEPDAQEFDSTANLDSALRELREFLAAHDLEDPLATVFPVPPPGHAEATGA